MSDNQENNTGGGAAVGGGVGTGGGNFTGRDENRQRTVTEQNASPNFRAGDNYFQGPGGTNLSDGMQIWMELFKHARSIQELSMQLENVTGRVFRLEKMELKVGPGPEVIIRPSTEALNISMRTLAVALGVLLIVTIAAVVYLITLRLGAAL